MVAVPVMLITVISGVVCFLICKTLDCISIKTKKEKLSLLIDQLAATVIAEKYLGATLDLQKEIGILKLRNPEVNLEGLDFVLGKLQTYVDPPPSLISMSLKRNYTIWNSFRECTANLPKLLIGLEQQKHDIDTAIRLLDAELGSCTPNKRIGIPQCIPITKIG